MMELSWQFLFSSDGCIDDAEWRSAMPLRAHCHTLHESSSGACLAGSEYHAVCGCHVTDGKDNWHHVTDGKGNWHHVTDGKDSRPKGMPAPLAAKPPKAEKVTNPTEKVTNPASQGWAPSRAPTPHKGAAAPAKPERAAGDPKDASGASVREAGLAHAASEAPSKAERYAQKQLEQQRRANHPGPSKPGDSGASARESGVRDAVVRDAVVAHPLSTAEREKAERRVQKLEAQRRAGLPSS